MTTWRKELTESMEPEESWEDVIDTTLTESELDKEFDDGYGGTEGDPFLLWTENRVYFPVCYDGSEWVESVPRNPCKDSGYHFNGGRNPLIS